jgi:prefoldin subunit 5
VSVQIRKILIYGTNGERRDVELNIGKLNIITGGSRTGKSALLGIIDFVWGRDECTIPEGPVRRTADWYGLLLDRDGEGIFLARRNPPIGASTSDEFHFVRPVSDAPDTMQGRTKNITADGLKATLGELLGISQNEFRPPEGSTRHPTPASARHAIIFCLQNQDEIASRTALFHRQAEPFLPQAIKDTLPYFLGAMDTRAFALQLQLDDARRQLRRLAKELAAERASDDEVQTRAQALIAEAKRVQLLPPDAAASGRNAALALLEDARRRGEQSDALVLTDPEADVVALQERRRELRASLRSLQDQRQELDQLLHDAAGFTKEAAEQRARLSALHLVRDNPIHDAETCPVCSSRLDKLTPTVADISAAFGQIRGQLEAVSREQPQVEKRRAEIREAIGRVEDQLRENHRAMEDRGRENARLQSQQALFLEQARALGRIGLYLETSLDVDGPGGLSERVDALNAQVAELERSLDPEALEERVITALNLVSLYMTEIATQLKLEHGSQSIRLDRKKLTIVADTIDGPIPLSQIGSGENWIGYHVAAHLGLHRLFLARGQPVPGFLVLDQPSQAHYPADVEDGASPPSDEDRAAVLNLFKCLHEFNLTHDGRFQIIIVDHVDFKEDWFAKSVAARWRNGIKLVPQSWLGDAMSANGSDGDPQGS